MRPYSTLSKIISLLAGVALLAALTAWTVYAAAFSPATAASNPLWQDVNEATLRPGGERDIVPDRYRTLALDADALHAALQQAPLETVSTSETLISLPMPDGGFELFRVWQSPIMAPALAAKFPHIKTYIVKGVDDPLASGRIDWTMHGFHAMFVSGRGMVFIDPYRRTDTAHYISYFKRDFTSGAPFTELGVLGDPGKVQELVANLGPRGITSGPELRTYRTAVAATGEYTAYFGGTVEAGMSAIVTAMNRVNEIYEREVAVRMVLVDNNDLIVYTNANTDPYTNSDGFAMLQENQDNLDAVIGDANYDVGHVFSTGGGGVAYLGVPCASNWKAQGVTGSPQPVGDPYVVDYVAHEMGHQFGANHTFNSEAGSCGGGNRNPSTAYEPGSGSTVMSYAGICGADDLQPHSDDTFHTVSFDEIIVYTTQGDGNTCPVITPTGNQAPLVDAGEGGFSIPKGTPFELTGSATDADGDPLTYVWDEFDLGPAGSPDHPAGNAPIFRSFLPVETPWRVFPKITDIVSNTHTIGELLPSYGRTLTFRLTARDNHTSPSAGGVAYDTITFQVAALAGPFRVTSPNTAVTWTGYARQAITWNVASTNLPPVSCSQVDIWLSTDGGYTYPILVVEGVPNDGSQEILVPNQPTPRARVKVACANNIFFDISNVDFVIVEGQPYATLSVGKQVISDTTLLPGDALTFTLTVTNSGITTATATITDTFPLGLVNPTCDGVPGDLHATASITPTAQVTYTCSAQADPGLSILITETASQPHVTAGGTVTYTIVVTNPSPTLTLTNIIVEASGVATCTPILGTPVTLGPLEGQAYVCASDVITQSTIATATVSADILIENTAAASAPEDPQGLVHSNTTTSRVRVEAQAMVAVQIRYWVYLAYVAR